MNKIKAFLVIALAVFSSQMVNGQTIYESDSTYNDVTMRFGADFKFPLTRKLSVTIEEEARLKNNISGFDRSYSSVGVDYRFHPNFKVGADYTFMAIWHDGKKSTDYNKYWDLRHRANLSLTASISYMNWNFSLRERPMATFRTLDFDPLEKVSPEYTLRSKFEVSYTARTMPLKPYFYTEISNTLNVPEYVGKNYIDKVRLNLGLKWRLNMRNSIEFFYRFDIGMNKDVNIDYKRDDVTIKAVYITNEKEYAHIVGIFYNFALK